MSLWRQITRGVRSLRNRNATDQEISDEINHYLEEATASFLAQGLSPDEARRAAQMHLGNATAVKQQMREYGWENLIETFVADVRYGARRLRANPGFTGISILTLALGIGASASIFSVINSVLVKPLSYPDSQRLVALLHTAPGINIKELNLAASLYLTYSEENRVFQDVGMWARDSWTVTGVAKPEEVPGLSVSHRFLSVLGVRPALGRDFAQADENPDRDRVVMLSDGYWRSRFGSDRSVIERRVLLDGNAYNIVGVLPPAFQFMDHKISVLAPFRMRRADIRLISFCCQGIARLKPGVTLDQADADVARMLPLAAEKFPMNPGWSLTAFRDARISPRLRWLKDVLVGDIGKTLWVLMATVGMVLGIACANVANLLLVRGEGRQHELKVRAALGAGGGRIARELLVESTLLGIAGGALGLALSYGALRILIAAEWVHLPRMNEISIDGFVVTFTISISLGASMFFGLVPALRHARGSIAEGLRSQGRSATGSKEREHARDFLVMLQVALALILVVASGLMFRTFRMLHRVDPGFSQPASLQTIRTGIPEMQVKDPERVARMEEEILYELKNIPGIGRAAAIGDLPLEGGENEPVFVEGKQYVEGSMRPVRRFKFVSPGYFATAGSRLLAGRDFTWNELHNRAPVALVSSNMARELWGSPRAAIGKRIRVTLKDDWREVIGVATDVPDDGIDHESPTIVYWPLLLKNFESTQDLVIRSLAYVIRTPRAGSASLHEEIQEAVGRVNASLPVSDVRSLESVYDRSLAPTSFTLLLLAIAGGVALLLGLVGLYGVISYSVAQRRREIGIRLALGAQRRAVVALFVRQGLLLSCIGALCGLVGALALTRLMKSLLFAVTPSDPATYLTAFGGLILAAFLGSYLPARRGAAVDPVETLRSE